MTYHKIIVDEQEPFLCSEDKTIMRTMCEKNAGHIQYGCCGGGCGVCKGRILEGKYEVVSKMSRDHISREEERIDIVLLCCVAPRSDLIIGSNY